MERPYLTIEGMPLKSNCPMPSWKEISEEEYKQICKERNDKIAVDQAKLEEEMRPIQKRNKLINQRMRKIAEDQLIEEGEIEKIDYGENEYSIINENGDIEYPNG